HWLTVRIVGHQTNRFGLGVRIGATIEEPAGSRTVYAFVGTNSSFGGNSLQEEMGLGKARTIPALEVVWPPTGKTDRFTDVPLDKAIIVEEGVGWREAAPPEARGG
ncbi:MAG TPA: ASPIC/UnbV domain-containing protein, partial [Planctomycetota bacterium]|nr:ASPIC/UnbV domain-containing protein [Planctomycetota bacterium]